MFTTFEGDNTVLLQLVAKGLLTDYATPSRTSTSSAWSGSSPATAVETVHRAHQRAHSSSSGCSDVAARRRTSGTRRPGCSTRRYQLAMLRWREEHMLAGVARRLKRGIDAGDWTRPRCSAACQDHVIGAARAHVERLVLEAFVDKLATLPRRADREVALNLLCDLYALSCIEADRAGSWSTAGSPRRGPRRSPRGQRACAAGCARSPQQLVDAFGVPREMLRAELLGVLRPS